MSASTPIQTSLNNLSAWASFDTLLQRLDITTDPNFWDGLVTLIHYQEYFLESQYNDLEEGCVPGEAQQGPNKTQTPNPPNQPDPECLCANSPFYALEIHGIECAEYRLLYWYHPDYGTSRATVARSKARLATVMRDLGHNEFITDYLSRACRGMAGLPYQYFHYSAFGETLVEDNAHYGQFSSPYRFNAKELDQEPSRASSRTPLKNKTWGEQTGNYYYGARYYNPNWSVWLSVDNLSDKFPSWSPYNFNLDNPVRLVDPDGNAPGDPGNGLVASVGIRIGAGNNGKLYGNINLSGGVAVQNSGFQGVAYSSLNIGLGQQLGTSPKAGSNLDFQCGAFMAGGSGSAGAHPIYTTNYNSPLPVPNTFESSFGIGVSRNFNFALNRRGDGPGWQWGTFNNIRFGGDFSLTHSNDGYLDLALGWTGLTFDNFDAGNTGAFSLHFGNEGLFSIGYQQFTGSLLDGPREGTGLYSQTPFQGSFNRANTFFQLGGLRMDYSGIPWLQNWIHLKKVNPLIDHLNSNYGILGISGTGD